MNRRFKLICLKAEALHLELEILEELDKKYELEFRTDFSRETAYLMEKAQRERSRTKQAPKERKAPDTEKVPSCNREDIYPSLKKVYRDLARKTHPDISPDKEGVEFKSIQKAYSEYDVYALLSAANRHSVDVNFDENDEKEIDLLIRRKRKKISSIKSTLRWAWGESKKEDADRASILRSLGISREKLDEWIAAKDVS